MTRQTWLKVAAVVLLAGGIGYLLTSLQVGDRRVGRAAVMLGELVLPPPFLIFRTLAPRDAHGRVAMLPLSSDDPTRHLTPLSCARVHYARGAGLCLVYERVQDVTVYAAYTFDRWLRRRQRIPLGGVPTRARVSPNGRRAAVTTYAEEESPQGERLVTQSVIIDMRAGRVIGNLRDFRVVNDGQPAITGPVDLSSVAFEGDGDRFFATLTTPTERYLAAGSVNERRITAIRAGVANEALSPDGNHLIVKRLVSESGFWQLAVIDLRTWAERDLKQGTRSVDDQVEWLDNDHVMYHDVVDDTTAIWMLPIDGITGPSVFVRDAFSGSAQR